MSTSLWSHGLQLTRLVCPWNSPGKNTGVGSHSLLQGLFLTQDWTWVSCIAGRFFTIRATILNEEHINPQPGSSLRQTSERTLPVAVLTGMPCRGRVVLGFFWGRGKGELRIQGLCHSLELSGSDCEVCVCLFLFLLAVLRLCCGAWALGLGSCGAGLVAPQHVES